MPKKLIAIVSLLFVVMFVLSACAKPTAAPVETPEATAAPTEAAVVYEEQPFGENLPTAPTIDTPLVVAYDQFSQKFSPFFADTGYDQDVASMTQISLLTTDRMGGIIYNAIEGETVPYNGTDYLYKGPADVKVEYDEATDTTKYTARLRVGMKFSDGVPVTADDIIFTYYTFLDPSYVGSTTLGSYDIVGLKDYQTQTTSDVYDKYATMADAIYAAGADHAWAATDTWTQEQQDDFWTRIKEGVTTEVQKIVDYVMANYLDYGPDYFGMTGEEITANDGLKVAYAMTMWGFGEKQDDGSSSQPPQKPSGISKPPSRPSKTTTMKSWPRMKTISRQPSRMNQLIAPTFSEM